MAAKVEIYDGSPWWASTDIWIIPGNDPNGLPGSPVAGQPNYLWANLHNTGSVDLNGIQVNFYWSNPATGVHRSTSNIVGSSYVNLIPGETKQVLCLTPWIPIVVNNGHECLIVEAITSLDPLPLPLPDAFDPPTFQQVAQKNVQVVALMPKMMFSILPLQISAASRKSKHVKLRIENGELSKKEQVKLFHQLGIKENFHQQQELVQFGISETGNCGFTKEVLGAHTLEMKLEENTAKCAFVHVAQAETKQGGYQILHIMETINNKVVGGNTIIILKK